MPLLQTTTGHTVAYDTFGDPENPPLLLIQGLSAQMLGWRDGFCRLLADHGFLVLRFDNRDVGESTHYPDSAYTLADMAEDTADFLAALGIERAHVVGQSMGGMIAQELALAHPDTVLSLGLVYTAAHHESIRGAARERMSSRVPRTREQAVLEYVESESVCGSTAYPQDVDWLRELGGIAYDRDSDTSGADRQLDAIYRTPDRAPRLSALRMPVLVLAGDADRLIDHRASEELHALIPSSRLVIHEGMGHELPRPLWEDITSAIAETARRAAVDGAPDAPATRPWAFSTRVAARSAVVQGDVAPGFERVADAFALNLRDREDTGAACTIMIGGTTVVDLHGGEIRPGVPQTGATRGAVFSVSKAVTTVCLLMASERGLLDLDRPVAAYWPEFAARGKDAVTVREVLAHRAGLPGPASAWSGDELGEWTRVTDSLAEQDPMWTPGAAHSYHAITVGFLAGEILRRATGMRPSEWLAEHIAGPLGLAATYGADPRDPDVAPITASAVNQLGSLPFSTEDLPTLIRIVLADGAYGPDLFTASNTPSFLGNESPAANLIIGARDLARLFSATVTPIDGVRLLSAETVAAASRPLSWGKPVLGPDFGHVWGTGFMLHSTKRRMAGPGSFGHDGAGGQLGFAHPGLELGFGYRTSLAGGDLDIRAEALCVALLESL